MNKLALGASTLTLCAVLTACSSAGEPTGPAVGSTTAGSSTSTTTPTTTSATPPTDSTSDATSSTTEPSSTVSGTAGPTPTSSTSTPVTIDQSTPEGAMTAWLGAMVSGDSTEVCALMASGGKPITDIAGAGKSCSTMIAPTVSELKKVGGAFAGLRITGATVKGNTATFEKATTKPALAGKVISGLKAVKVGSKWYVTP